MSPVFDRFQILYKIALSIGDGENLEQASEKALSTYVQMLNCFGGAIYRKRSSENLYWYDPVIVKPVSILEDVTFSAVLNKFSTNPEKPSKESDSENLPISFHSATLSHVYALELPSFGLLILLKNGDSLPDDFITELKPLCKKLADAFNSFATQKKLRDSKLLLSNLIHSIPDLIWLKDKAGAYLACNSGFEDFLGVHESDVVGRTDVDFHKMKLAGIIDNKDDMVLSLDKPVTDQKEVIVAKNGIKTLFEIIKTPLKDDDGNVLGMLGIARDITRRKHTESALKKSEQRFQEMANMLPQPIWEIDINGNLTYANKAGFEVFGYKPADINKGLKFTEVIAQEDRHRIVANFEKKLTGQQAMDYEYKCLTKDGKSFAALIYTSPIKTDDRVTGFRGITIDISGLKKAQENLKYFSDLQNVLISISTQYINVSTDRMDEAIDSALKEMGEFVSADRAYIFNYDFERGFTNNTYEWCRAGIEPQIENLQEVPLDAIPQWTEKHLVGEPVYVPNVYALPIGDSLREVLEPQKIKSLLAVPMLHQGNCLGFIGFDSVKDYHHYTEKEKSILEVFAQIVVNLQMRTQAVEELKKAKEIAENAEKAQFNFLSTMSHEIRTPLNAVIGITNILLMESPRPDQVDNLNMMKFSSQNLLNIINDILDYNKLASGNVILEQIDFDIRDIVKGVLFSLNNIAKSKNITLDYFIDPQISEVIVGDSTRFMQIVNNLVSNALKFTKTGGVSIHVKELNRSKKFTRLLVSVSDSGIGIPADKFDSIFEEFKQTSSSITREYGGTGLGLPIVKRLLKAMGSEIHLESEEGKGSVFSFEIEFLIGDPKKLRPKNEKVIFDDSLKNVNVLLVEDNKINQMVARKFLDEWKCNTFIAENGQIAIQMLKEAPYDVVLMDLQMPVMDGYQATKEIRNMPDSRLSKIPVIALSASALGEIETRARKYGMNDFVTKPFVPEVLFQAIIKQIKMR
jgi:PAS domain S-box-containing protein